MPRFQSRELREATPRQLAALRRMHAHLRAEGVKVGIWPFRRREWRISCPDCGWVSERNVPVMPAEMTMTEAFLLDDTMEQHLVTELRKLTFAQVWLERD